MTDLMAMAVQPRFVFPWRSPAPTAADLEAGINTCLLIQRRAVSFGKRPFGACLVGPDNETVLLMHQSIDRVNHAESTLARLAASHYSTEYLWTCTLYSTWEPCAMCTATIYWSHIGRVVYAASNEQLAELTGPGNPENFTMEWNCREIFLRAQKDVEVIGPIDGLDKKVMTASDDYWRATRDGLGSS